MTYMKLSHYVSLVAASLVTIMSSAQDSTLKVLFIGNSYTHVNDLPTMVERVVSSVNNGQFKLAHDNSTPGGWYWYKHVNDSTTLSKIKKGNWDVVVLQEQSQMLSLPDSTIAKESIPHLQVLVDSIKRSSPNAKLFFYRTWGRKNGDAQNGVTWPAVATYEGMDSLLSKRYSMLADSLKGKLVPVGDVWKAIRKTHPEIELYSEDGSHPSLAGTYAAAITFANAFFGVHPLDVTFESKLSAEQAIAIRKVAESVLVKSSTSKGEWKPRFTKKKKTAEIKAPRKLNLEGPQPYLTHSSSPLKESDEQGVDRFNHLAIIPSNSERRRRFFL